MLKVDGKTQIVSDIEVLQYHFHSHLTPILLSYCNKQTFFTHYIIALPQICFTKLRLILKSELKIK